ncbi:hypothetical protein BH11PSE8_BH11PSE8_31580 [soil metagenome]
MTITLQWGHSSAGNRDALIDASPSMPMAR